MSRKKLSVNFARFQELENGNLTIKEWWRNALSFLAILLVNCTYQFGNLPLHLDKSVTDKLLEDTKLLSKEKQVN